VWQIHLVVVRVTPGLWFVMIGRSVFSAGMIRVDVLRILRVILMLMMALGMGVLDHDGRTNVSDRAKKCGKHQQPTCKDGVKAVLFTRRHGENQMKFQPTLKLVAAASSHPGSVWQDFVRARFCSRLKAFVIADRIPGHPEILFWQRRSHTLPSVIR
jgi:hypothetical protein